MGGTIFEFSPYLIITRQTSFVKKNHGRKQAPSSEGACAELLLPEGLAVGALILGGVHFVGTYQNPIQRTVVLTLAMIGALLDGTLDALVGMAVHGHFLLLIGFGNSMVSHEKLIQEKFPNVAFCRFVWYGKNER